MAEGQDLQPEEEGLVALEEKHWPDTGVTVLYTARGGQRTEDESECLLGNKHQSQVGTDGGETSAQHELLSAGSVSSLCSRSSRHECPICSEPFSAPGELLLCGHALCHRCVSGIMRRAEDPGRLRCPFCRQTTPMPQWEIRRLQEESYSGGGGGGGVFEPALPAAGPGPGLEAVLGAGGDGCCSSCAGRGARLRCACLSISALLLLCLLLLLCFLYTVVPVTMLAAFFKNG